MVPPIRSVDKCQSCGQEDLQSLFYLGYLPPVNKMTPLDAPHEAQEWYPAELLFCPHCSLVQLGYIVPAEILFPHSYPYTSGTTRILVENFADLAKEAEEFLGLSQDTHVLDIGSNDGTLLNAFKERGMAVVGIEPTKAADLANSKGIPTHKAYLSLEAIDTVLQSHRHFDVVTAANVFAHMAGVAQVMQAVDRALSTNGIFITESHYLGAIVEGLQYDTIYHEHLRYYSLTSIRNLLEKHGFHVIHARHIPTHGGSLRVYATRDARVAPSESVAEILLKEQEKGLAGAAWVKPFVDKVSKSKLSLYSLLSGLSGERVAAVGAPSRASTLVNFTGLDVSLIEAVYEIAGSAKIGHYLPGTSIPVLDEAVMYEDQPDYLVLLSWHIAEDLCRAIKQRGYKGDFIVPLPEPQIIRNSAIGTEGIQTLRGKRN